MPSNARRWRRWCSASSPSPRRWSRARCECMRSRTHRIAARPPLRLCGCARSCAGARHLVRVNRRPAARDLRVPPRRQQPPGASAPPPPPTPCPPPPPALSAARRSGSACRAPRRSCSAASSRCTTAACTRCGPGDAAAPAARQCELSSSARPDCPATPTPPPPCRQPLHPPGPPRVPACRCRSACPWRAASWTAAWASPASRPHVRPAGRSWRSAPATLATSAWSCRFSTSGARPGWHVLRSLPALSVCAGGVLCVRVGGGGALRAGAAGCAGDCARACSPHPRHPARA